MSKKFSIDKTIEKGWEAFKKSAAGLILITLASFIVNIAFELLETSPNTSDIQEYGVSAEPWQIGLGIFLYLVIIFLGIASQQAALDAAYGRDIGSKTFENSLHRLPSLIGATILIILPYLLILVSAFAFPPLAILLGIVIGIPYTFYITFNLPQTSYAILENKMGPIEAFKHSHKIMQGNKFKFFLVQFCFLGINLLGALCLLVGLIITIPATAVMNAHIFKQIN